MSTAHSSVAYQLGDEVTFESGGKTVHAQVIEVRGPIGVGGRTLYRLRVIDEAEEWEEAEETELPADRLRICKSKKES